MRYFTGKKISSIAITVAAVVDAIPVLPRSPSTGSFDLPLTWTPFGFITEAITIGTPAQRMSWFVDWTWIGHYVFSTLCHGSSSRTHDCLASNQTIFNQTQSTTFENQSSLYPSRTWNPNHFFFYKDLTVTYGSDIEHIDPGRDARTTLMLSDQDFQSDTPYPFTGVYGLSPVFKTDDKSTQSPFYQQWSSGTYSSPIVSYHYCYPGRPKTTCKSHDALQTLGGHNETLIKGEISWYDNIVFPEVNSLDFVYTPALLNYWALPLTKLSLGAEPQALNATTGAAAIFDHASYGRGAALSVNAYKRLIELTDAKPITLTNPPNNGNQSFVQVDCSRRDSFPVLKYQFGKGTREWETAPSHYVEDVGNGTCVLNVRTLGEAEMVVGNFGETFARDKYVLFDFERLRVGLADLKW